MNPTQRTSIVLGTLLSLALAGCGSTVDPGEGGGGGGAGGAGGSGGTGGSGGGPDVCEAYEDPETLEPTRTVTIRIVNDTGADLFLGDTQPGCGGYVPFTVERGGVEVKSQPDVCEPSCGQAMQGQCACAADCAMPEIVRITPGGSYETTWFGMEYLPTSLPAQCVGEGCQGACVQPEVASGQYDLLGVAHTSIGECVDGESGCDCTPDANGSCVFFTTTPVEGTPLETTATYDFGGVEDTVELRFE